MNTAPQSFPLTFGLNTFGDVTSDPAGSPISHAQTIRDLVGHGVAAEAAGLDFYGIGEHHTDDMPLSAADVVLSAIAARTSRIHLGSAVTVLSSDDPVRVFQRYSTLNAVSDGRAEVILGRGSSIDSFPLFGFELSDYEDLFEEKTNLFAHLLEGGPVTWEGRTRAALRDQDVVPHLETPLPTWIGVGGSPESVIRAAHYGFSLMLAVIGGPASRFAPLRRAVPQGARAVRAPAAADRPPLARTRRRHGRAGARRVLAALPGHDHQGQRHPRLRHPDRSHRSGGSSVRTAACTWARPRRSPRRSPRTCAWSARTGSTSSTASPG